MFSPFLHIVSNAFCQWNGLIRFQVKKTGRNHCVDLGSRVVSLNSSNYFATRQHSFTNGTYNLKWRFVFFTKLHDEENLISWNWQCEGVGRKTIENRHHISNLEDNYVLNVYNVHFKISPLLSKTNLFHSFLSVTTEVCGGMFSQVFVHAGEVSVQWDVCPGGSLCPEVGVCQGQPPPPYGKERVVRILLQCILVL